MKTLVVVAHPNTDKSFNHAITATVRDTLREMGHDVSILDLYADGFNPVLPFNEEKLDISELPEDIASYMALVQEADGIVFVHPNWWSMPPAILKGWLDRVFRAGFAYRFSDKGAVPLFSDKIAQIFTTSNTPREIEEKVYGNPLEKFWTTIVFGLCGSKSFEYRNFEPVIVSSEEDRKNWLDEVAQTIRRRFA